MSVMYFNGTMLTMDEACPQVEALLVGDGRIRKRGTLEAVSAAMGADCLLYTARCVEETGPVHRKC